MRALAIFGLIILIAAVVLVTLAAVNYMGFRDTVYDLLQNTVLMPIHDFIVNGWIQIGNMGFTYIAAAILGIAVGGGLFLTFIVYGLFWHKLIQQKLHKTVPTAPIAPMQRTLTLTPPTLTQPTETAITTEQEPKKQETP